MRRVHLLVIGATALVLVPFSRAAADVPATAGWWTSDALPTPPPDVPVGGLEVSSTPAGSSYAALGYYDTSGRQVTTVVLTVDQSALNVPDSQVEACPLTGSGAFKSSSGGAAKDGPAYDCRTHVVGVSSPSSGSVSFAVGNWSLNGYLGVAIVATNTGRTVFDAPKASVIQLAPASPPPTDAAPTTAVPTLGDQTPSSVPSVPDVVPPAPAPVPTSESAPTTVQTIPLTTSTTTAVSTSSTTVPRAVELASTVQTDTIGVGGSVVGAVLVLGGVLYAATRHRRASISDTL